MHTEIKKKVNTLIDAFIACSRTSSAYSSCRSLVALAAAASAAAAADCASALSACAHVDGDWHKYARGRIYKIATARHGDIKDGHMTPACDEATVAGVQWSTERHKK